MPGQDNPITKRLDDPGLGIGQLTLKKELYEPIV